MKNFLPFIMLALCGMQVFGQVELRYHLRTGSIFRVKQEAHQTVVQELDGASHEIINHITGVLQFKVVGKKEDNYVLELEFKDLNLKMTSSIQGELMNVRAKELVQGDMQSAIFNSILNSPITITLAKNGNILDVKGGNALVDKMTDASGLEDEFSLNMMRRSLEKEFGSEALSNSYEQMTYLYPDKKVAVGDTWENMYKGKSRADTSWTLKELSQTEAKISGKATVTMQVSEPTTSMELSGTQTTTVTTDLSTGFVSFMTVEGTSKGYSIIAQMGEQKVPTKITSKVTYKLIKE
ncbi:MAG: DUF6263 family protein [Sediminicola sp.]